MAFFKKGNLKHLRALLETHLPQTQPKIVMLRTPILGSAVQVFWNGEDAYNYFTSRGYWWVVSANQGFMTLSPHNTGLRAKQETESLCVVIAGSIANSYRKAAYPLQADSRVFRTPNPSKMQEIQSGFSGPHQFLSAVSNRRIPLAEAAVNVALLFTTNLDNEIEQHFAEVAGA
jgi:hypothetical protein